MLGDIHNSDIQAWRIGEEIQIFLGSGFAAHKYLSKYNLTRHKVLHVESGPMTIIHNFILFLNENLEIMKILF